MADLIKELTVFLKEAAESEEGQKLLQGTPLGTTEFIGRNDFQFDVSDGEPFYVRFLDRKISVHKGRTDRTSLRDCVYGEIDEATLKDLMVGRVSPYQAVTEDRWKDITGGSHPKRPFLCLLSVLFRIGQEIAIRKRLEAV